MVSTKSRARWGSLELITYFDSTQFTVYNGVTDDPKNHSVVEKLDLQWQWCTLATIFMSAVAVIIGNHNKILFVWLVLSTSSATVFNNIIFVSTSWCKWSCPTPRTLPIENVYSKPKMYSMCNLYCFVPYGANDSECVKEPAYILYVAFPSWFLGFTLSLPSFCTLNFASLSIPHHSPNERIPDTTLFI